MSDVETRDTVAMAARLLFVERDHGVVKLDGVVASDAVLETGEPLDVGTPFFIRATLPWTMPWAANATEEVLHRWANTDVAIDMRLSRGPEGYSVRLSDASTQLNLCVAA